jgi:hypothetical protein
MEAAIACDYWRKNRQITREITGGGSGGTSDIMAQAVEASPLGSHHILTANERRNKIAGFAHRRDSR